MDANNPELRENVDDLVIKHKFDNPKIGIRMHMGYMRNTNLNVTRLMLIDSLVRVYLPGLLHRKSITIVRRRYYYKLDMIFYLIICYCIYIDKYVYIL